MARNPDGGQKVDHIYQQLQNDFHPAVKNLALTGQDVTKAHQAFTRSLQAYVTSVKAFAITGKGAEEPSRQVAKELYELTNVWQKTIDEHGKWSEHFAKVNVAVSRNAESEKDRLKTLHQTFTKKEKDLKKEVEKGRKSRANLDEFYDAEIERATNQQKQRYKFFNEKHVELLKTHLVNCKFAIDAGQDVVDNYQASLNGQSRTATVDTQSPHAERKEASAPEVIAVSKRSSVISAAQKSIKSQPQIVEVHDDAADEKSLIDQLDALQEAAVDVPASKRQSVAAAITTEEALVIAAAVPEKKTTETQADLPPKPVQNGHGPKPEAYAPSYYDPRPVSAEAAYYPPPARVEEQRPPSPPPRAIYDPRPPPQEDYYPAPQKVLPSSIYRPTPLVAQLKADRERAGYSVPQYDERRPNPADVYDALYRQDSANDGGDYRNGGGDGPVHQKLANTPAYVPLYAPIPERINERPPKPYQPERPLSQVAPAPPVAQKPTWQQRRESAQASQPSSPPAAPKVLPRPLFSAADYGRMVECTTSYDATADNQLSLKTGDKVVLVKSGSRGWVLGRSEDGAKQGWFPAKFLKLL